ncbi:MAG: hypothetical protein KGZ34_10065 [Nitrosarchaeum sp.]|nr:hypothetical protein [Nitrosarchaeum sp.]
MICVHRLQTPDNVMIGSYLDMYNRKNVEKLELYLQVEPSLAITNI